MGRRKCNRSSLYCDCSYHRARRDKFEAEEYAERQEATSRGTSDGDRWTAGDGTTHTVNSTLYPNVPGGYYHSQTDKDGNKATAVFDEDGSLADIKQNKGWWDV